MIAKIVTVDKSSLNTNHKELSIELNLQENNLLHFSLEFRD